MKIGYLHIGPEQHGIRQYGESLVAQARHNASLSVIEVNVTLTSDWQQNRKMLADAARQLSVADVIHFQYNRSLWGGRSWAQFVHLSAFLGNCTCPLVATLHDVYLQRKSPLWQQAKPLNYKNVVDYIQQTYGPYALLLQWMFNQLQQILVCTEEEARRIREFVDSSQLKDSKKLKVVPHFVKERTVKPIRTSARAALGLTDAKVLTVLGWIHSGKGHRLIVEALPELPSDVKLIFAGRPSLGCEGFAQELLDLAAARGVSDRLQITGYLSDEEQARYLVATDLAVCPFREISASGSLSTWISVARPILASDLPQMHEYNQLEPGAIQIFRPYTPGALAEAIRNLLPRCTEREDARVARLRQQLGMPKIFDQHLSYYRQVAKGTAIAPTETVTV